MVEGRHVFYLAQQLSRTCWWRVVFFSFNFVHRFYMNMKGATHPAGPVIDQTELAEAIGKVRVLHCVWQPCSLLSAQPFLGNGKDLPLLLNTM